VITYQYRARDKAGKLVQGFVEADSESALVIKLEQMGYIPVFIAQKAGDSGISKFFEKLRRSRVKFEDINIFTRLLFTLQKAGLPILSSLRAIKEQTINERLKEIIGQVASDVETGSALSFALEKHPQAFNNLYVNMVRSGEVSGRLSETLERLTILGEHDEVIRLQIKAALRYPVIVISAIIVAFLVLIAFVVPRYESLFSQFDAQLPLPTRILLGINYAVTKFWWMTLIFIGASIVLFQKLLHTPRGASWWYQLQLKVPVFGPLLLKLYMSRFSRITGILLSSGVPILQILELVEDSMNNGVVAQAVKKIKMSVNDGKGMLGPMKASQLFPPVVIQMVSAGEETGKLDELLIYVSEYYDSQVDYTIKNLVSLIEPFLILVMGCAVLLMALGIFLPMWNLMHLFSG